MVLCISSQKLLYCKISKIMYTNIIMNWLIYAILGAVFAAFTAIFAKIGIKNIDSNLATAIRTVVVIIFAWSIVFYQGTFKEISSISKFSLTFLILSGIATGLSWLFYFKALQLGQASQVSPIDKLSLVFTIILAFIVLREKVTALTVIGVIFMTIGAFLIGFGK
jgi:bacterial/archaeal transporter family protein